jgi:hypothetical protein
MKGKANGGQGGKLGHSNMDHWVYTEEIKAAARKQRRLEAKEQIAGELRQLRGAESAVSQSPKGSETD